MDSLVFLGEQLLLVCYANTTIHVHEVGESLELRILAHHVFVVVAPAEHFGQTLRSRRVAIQFAGLSGIGNHEAQVFVERNND